MELLLPALKKVVGSPQGILVYEYSKTYEDQKLKRETGLCACCLSLQGPRKEGTEQAQA